MEMTRREFFDRATGMLTSRYGNREAQSIAHLVMESLCGVTRAHIALDPAATLKTDDAQRAITQIAAGEPVQYVLGEAWFCGRAFEVNRETLIPRGETEELIAWIVREHGGQSGLRILDVGTGSGAIAVTLALKLPASQVTATDISPGALAVATRNALSLGADVAFLHSDILKEWPAGRFELIVSNPPYIPLRERHSMAHHVTHHEPQGALFVPDHDPLLFYRTIVRGGQGMFYFEIHEHFAGEMREMLGLEGCTQIEVKEDIHGKPRMVRCRK